MALNDETNAGRSSAAASAASAATARGDVSAADLAPDTGRALTAAETWRFGLGFALFSLLWMTAGTSGSQVLLPQRFTELGIGVPEVILGTMNSVGCVFALVANVMFGALSDITRSRFGKRTPWIVLGGLITAAGYLLAANSAALVGIVAGWSVVQVGVNMMIAPAVAVLSDRIPERTRGTFSAFYGGAQIVGQSAGTFMGAQFLQHMGAGFLTGAVLFALTGIVAVLVWPRERPTATGRGRRRVAGDPAAPAGAASEHAHRSRALSASQRGAGAADGDVPASETAQTAESAHGAGAAKLSAGDILRSFIPPTRGCRDFYLALVGRLLLMVGWSMVATYQLYILQQYVGLSVDDSGAVISTMSVISMIVLIVTSVISGPLSDRLGRRKIIVAVGSLIIAVGIAIPIIQPTALGMMLYAGVAGTGYGIYIAVDQALNVDVLPSQDEAGKDLGILNLANTVGQVLAPVIVGGIVVVTGSYATIFPIAIGCVLVGAVVIMLIRSVR